MIRRVGIAAAVLLAAGLTIATWASRGVDRPAVVLAADAQARVGLPVTAAAPAPHSAWTGGPGLAAVQPPTTRPPSATPSLRAETRVPLTIDARRQLLVGETGELVVTIGSTDGGADIGEVAFTAQLDANVLQVRAGSEGDWAARPGLRSQFVADIASAEDRVQIRSTVVGRRQGGSPGSVAIVQFQAVAPGATSITVSDVTVRDGAGRSMTATVAGASVQVSVESPRIVQPGGATKLH